MSDAGSRKRRLADVIEDIVFEDAKREQLAMMREELDADMAARGYDAEAFGKEIDEALAKAVAVPPRSRADVIEDIVFEDALAEQRKMTPAELDADLASRGLDGADLEASLAEAMSKAGLPAFETESASGGKIQSGSTAKVVDFQAERERRAGKTRWMLFLPAAAAFAVTGGGATQMVATTMPTPTVEYPTNTHPLTPQQIGEVVRGRALRLCRLKYWGECEDLLDKAAAIDPDGESEKAVREAREDISRWHRDQPPGVEERDRELQRRESKGPLGPGERKLQRK